MTEVLTVSIHADKRKIWEQVKAKTKGCGTPLHWTIRDPVGSNSKIYLKPKEIDKKKGRYIQLRRLLFYLEYDVMPVKNIYMVCKDEDPNCVNVSHMRISGWENEALFTEMIPHQIERGILYPDDAERWFGYKGE